MPSGDAIQSALFTNYLCLLGVPAPYLIIFHIGVCLGRVYYMCHWVLDTVVSTILGTAIAYVIN
jgi:putative flippase GtrA